MLSKEIEILYIIYRKKIMTTNIEQITQLMTITQEEDERYLREVVSEIKIKRSRGRPRIHPAKDPML